MCDDTSQGKAKLNNIMVLIMFLKESAESEESGFPADLALWAYQNAHNFGSEKNHKF